MVATIFFSENQNKWPNWHIRYSWNVCLCLVWKINRRGAGAGPAGLLNWIRHCAVFRSYLYIFLRHWWLWHLLCVWHVISAKIWLPFCQCFIQWVNESWKRCKNACTCFGFP